MGTRDTRRSARRGAGGGRGPAAPRWLRRGGAAAVALLWLATAAQAADLTGTVVDAAGAPLAGAVVFAQALPAGTTLPPAPRTALMDQIDKQFVPRVLPVAIGTAVSFPNRDQIHHHVYSFSKAKTFEIPLYKGEATEPVVFDVLGAVQIGCNIHDWMSGVILVVPTPYFAVSDADGAFTLVGLPDGKTPIAAWHEGLRTSLDATVQRIDVGAATPPPRFTIDAAARRGRSVGARGGE